MAVIARKDRMMDNDWSWNGAMKRADFSRRLCNNIGGATAAGGCGGVEASAWWGTGGTVAATDAIVMECAITTGAGDDIGELFLAR